MNNVSKNQLKKQPRTNSSRIADVVGYRLSSALLKKYQKFAGGTMTKTIAAHQRNRTIAPSPVPLNGKIYWKRCNKRSSGNRLVFNNAVALPIAVGCTKARFKP